jgi:hypothetical protein
MVVDQGQALLGGMQVVPDLAAITARNQQIAMQRQALAMREQEMRDAVIQQQQAIQRQAQWDDFVGQVTSGQADDETIRRGILAFPEQREAITAAFGNPRDAEARSNLRLTGALWTRLRNGDTAGAATILRQRVEADSAAGREDPEDVEMLRALESGDPQAIAGVQGMLGVVIAAMPNAGDFTQALGRLNPTQEPTTFQRDYAFILQNFGPQVAANFRARNTDRTATDAAGNIVELPDAALIGPETQPRGGDRPSGGSGGTNAPATSPEAIMGRATQTGTMTRADYEALARQLGPQGRTAMDGWLTQNGVRLEGGNAPVTVRTVQQAERLAPGTRYRTPDGREFVR